MNQRDRTIGSKALLLPAMCISIAAVLVLTGSQGTAQAEATLILPTEIKTGVVLEADRISLLSVLDELATRTGMVIEGRQNITDRQISGRYEGDVPEILEDLLRGENYTLILGSAGDQGYTPVAKIIFSRQPGPNQVGRAKQVITQTPDKLSIAKAKPRRTNTETSKPTKIERPVAAVNDPLPPPPVAPHIDAFVLYSISRPPPKTIESQRFHAAVEKTREELEDALAPLKNLR